jgi:hypothetical protein
MFGIAIIVLYVGVISELTLSLHFHKDYSNLFCPSHLGKYMGRFDGYLGSTRRRHYVARQLVAESVVILHPNYLGADLLYTKLGIATGLSPVCGLFASVYRSPLDGKRTGAPVWAVATAVLPAGILACRNVCPTDFIVHGLLCLQSHCSHYIRFLVFLFSTPGKWLPLSINPQFPESARHGGSTVEILHQVHLGQYGGGAIDVDWSLVLETKSLRWTRHGSSPGHDAAVHFVLERSTRQSVGVFTDPRLHFARQ